MTPGHELRALDVATTQSCGWYEQLGVRWAKASRFYEQLRVMYDMNDSRSWARGSRCYEQLRVVVDMKDYELCTLGSRCYEQLINVDDMNGSRSRDLRLLDAMNNSSLRMIWMILGCEPMTLNAKNSLGLCMTWIPWAQASRCLGISAMNLGI